MVLQESAERGLALNDHMLKGRRLAVTIADSRPGRTGYVTVLAITPLLTPSGSGMLLAHEKKRIAAPSGLKTSPMVPKRQSCSKLWKRLPLW